MTKPSRGPRTKLPAHLRRRARPAVPTVTEWPAPQPLRLVGHFDGPTSAGDQIVWAKFLATGIVPPIYRRNPGACLTLICKAQALDIPIAIALENLYWSEATGKGSISAQLMGGLLRRHGYSYKVTEETPDRVAMTFWQTVDGRRRKLGDVQWTIIEAVAAGLTWREEWRTYPTDSLWARCLMRGARRYASEVGTGLAYTIEEVADMGAPAEGSEVNTAVKDILERATAPDTTSAHIRGVLVKEAKARKLLALDLGDGTTLGQTLGMLWGEARAREAEHRALTAAAVPAVEPEPAPAGVGTLPCGCPAEKVLRTGQHAEHRTLAEVTA